MADNLEYLYTIQSQYSPCIAELPGAQTKIYQVNLNERTIDSPKSIGISSDHKAEVIYFMMDRYYDFMDLTNTSCIIQYVTPHDGGSYVYVVPYYDIYTYRDQNKLIIPWNIDGAATQNEGIVQYSIRFFKIKGEGPEGQLVYNLNTLPATTEIIKGLNIDPNGYGEVNYETKAYEQIMQHISELNRKGTYWEILE